MLQLAYTPMMTMDWERPKELYHAHFDCFSGAAGDMMLASCLDACGNDKDADRLLRHITHCIEEGLPELKGEFSIERRQVWRGGLASIAATHVTVHSRYSHAPAPVPTNLKPDWVGQSKSSATPTKLKSEHTLVHSRHSARHEHSHPKHPELAHDHHSHHKDSSHSRNHNHDHSAEAPTHIHAHDKAVASNETLQQTLNHDSATVQDNAQQHEADESRHSHAHDHNKSGVTHGHDHNHETEATTERLDPIDADHSGPHHEHSHDHGHQSSSGPLRNYTQIRTMLENAAPHYIPPWVQGMALTAFTELASAEAKSHGVKSLDSVHFHEVGAVDSIVDTVGTLLALYYLGVSTVSCSRLPMGEGMVRTDHGWLPVPAPATLFLTRGMPTCAGPPGWTGELVTPTGAALLRVLTSQLSTNIAIGRPPAFTIRYIGIGAGTKDFQEHPNILRLIIGNDVLAVSKPKRG